mgnify:CR=1 FL=1
MAGGDIGSIIDTLVYNAVSSYYTGLIKVPDADIYIVGDMVGAGADLTLYSFACDSLGNIGAAPIDSLVLEDAGSPSGMRSIIHISGDVFACAFNASAQVVVKTFTCDTSGNLGAAAIDTINLGAISANISFMPDLKHVQSDIYVVSYTYNAGVGGEYRGQISTIRINSDGTIDEPVLSTLTYMAAFGIKPNLLKVTNNHFLHIAGETTPAIWGKLRQINITDAGILSQIASDLGFDNVTYDGGTVHRVSGDVYVIFYKGGPSDTFGMMITVTANFVDTPTPIDSWEYYSAALDWPRGIEISKNQAGNGKIYAVMSGIDGAVANQLRTFNILNNGTITEAALDTQQVNARYANGPDIIHGVGEMYIISARSGAAFDKGTVYSVDIEAAISSKGGLNPGLVLELV